MFNKTGTTSNGGSKIELIANALSQRLNNASGGSQSETSNTDQDRAAENHLETILKYSTSKRRKKPSPKWLSSARNSPAIFNSLTQKAASIKTFSSDDLIKQLSGETWIQCDEPRCQKWRRVPTTLAEQLADDEKWYCRQNSDPNRNSCCSLEEDYTNYEKLMKKCGLRFVESVLQGGTIVWAKMTGYCRWPAVICPDPACDLSVTLIGGSPRWYHVEYFGEPHTHGWVTAKNVEPYGKTPEKSSGVGRGKSRSKQTYKKQRVDDALKEAETWMPLTMQERLQKIVFKVRNLLENPYKKEKDAAGDNESAPPEQPVDKIVKKDDTVDDDRLIEQPLPSVVPVINIESYRNNDQTFNHDLQRFLKRRGLKIGHTPRWQNKAISLCRLFLLVVDRGGFDKVTESRQWSRIFNELTGCDQPGRGHAVKVAYSRHLLAYEKYLTDQKYMQPIGDVLSDEIAVRNGRGKRKHEDVVHDDFDKNNQAIDCVEIDLDSMLAELETIEVECSSNYDDNNNVTKDKHVKFCYHDDSPHQSQQSAIETDTTLDFCNIFPANNVISPTKSQDSSGHLYHVMQAVEQGIEKMENDIDFAML